MRRQRLALAHARVWRQQHHICSQRHERREHGTRVRKGCAVAAVLGEERKYIAPLKKERVHARQHRSCKPRRVEDAVVGLMPAAYPPAALLLTLLFFFLLLFL